MEEMTDPGGAESSKSIPREDKKRSKLKSFLNLPKFIQKAFKGIRNLLEFVNLSKNYKHLKNTHVIIFIEACVFCCVLIIMK